MNELYFSTMRGRPNIEFMKMKPFKFKYSRRRGVSRHLATWNEAKCSSLASTLPISDSYRYSSCATFQYRSEDHRSVVYVDPPISAYFYRRTAGLHYYRDS